ncbi:MAG: PAS domain S-box protein [Nitrospira sp.]|nr:PAS domain S-box protein [Nitrospira sp.]
MKLWGQSHSLHRKIIAAIVLVGLLPLTFSLILTYLTDRRALHETIGTSFRERAVEAASRVEMQVTRSINEAEQLATTPFLRTAVREANKSYVGKDASRIESIIQDFQKQWRQRRTSSEFPLFINRIVTNYLIRWHDIRKADYVGILVTDAQGALVISSIPQAEYFHGKSLWWQAAFTGGKGMVFVSEPAFEPSYGTHVLTVSVPILDDDQRSAIGVIGVLLKREALFRIISEVTIGETGHAMLMNSDGVPLLCPILALEEHSITPALASLLQPMQAGWAIAGNDSHGGRDSLVGYAPVRLGNRLAPDSLGGKHWMTFVRQNPEETYTVLNQLLVKVLAYGALVFAVLVTTGAWVARRIARPIAVLHEGVARIGSGNLAHQLSLKTGDELEQLAAAFNGMAGNLKQSFDQIEQRSKEIDATKRYLENLLENANDVIYTLDTEQCFTYVNNRVSGWGYRKEDLIGRPYLSLLTKRHRGKRLKSTLDIGAKQVYEVEVLAKNGTTRTVTVSVSPLYDAQGGIDGVLGIARDITETKKLEQQIRSSEKLASVGKLAAGVAHEINNPLGGILNCLYNFQKGTLSEARRQQYLVSIEDGLRRVQKIVRQLLDFSQQHAPEFSLTHLNEVVDRVLVLTEHALTEKKIHLDKQFQRDLPPLMVDRHMIEQVLMNLLLNAVHALKAGGTIMIRTRAQGDTCEVVVEDTGCGIPAHVLPHIFDPFFTTKGTGEGTGLGLSVSLGIVERHGGRILVDSEAGKGSVFTVCLPMSHERATVGGAS